MKKFEIFVRNHGLTPYEKSTLVTIKNQYFYSLQRLVFYPKYHETFFLGLFCSKRKNEENENCCPK